MVVMLQFLATVALTARFVFQKGGQLVLGPLSVGLLDGQDN